MKKLMIATLIATSGYFMPAMAANTDASQGTEINASARRIDLFDYRCTARSNRSRGSFTARGETRNIAQRKAVRQCERNTRFGRCYVTSCQRILGFRW